MSQRGRTGSLRVVQGLQGRLLTVAEAAERLSCSTATVYKLCASGELPSIRVLNAVRIRPDDLDAFVARGARR